MSYALEQISIEKRLERWERERAEAARIRCPQCNEVLYDARGVGYEDHPVSYWGDETHTVWCSECDIDIEVQEHVERTFKVLG